MRTSSPPLAPLVYGSHARIVGERMLRGFTSEPNWGLIAMHCRRVALLAVAVLFLIAGGRALAATPEQKCTAKKLLRTGDKVEDDLKCYAKFSMVDESRNDDKFTNCKNRALKKFTAVEDPLRVVDGVSLGCPGTLADLANDAENCLNTLKAYYPPQPKKDCFSRSAGSVARAAGDLLKCKSKVAKSGGSFDFTTCDTKNTERLI